MIEVSWNRSTILASLLIHGLVLGVFALLLALFPGGEPEPDPIDVVFYKPGERVPPPPPVIPEPEPEPEPEIVPEPEPQVAKAEPPPPPKPELKPEPKPEPVRVAEAKPRPEPPKPKKPVVTKRALAPEPEPKKTPKRPRRAVQTNVLNAAVPKPAAKLETEKRQATTGSFGTSSSSEPREATRRNLRAGTSVGGFTVDDASTGSDVKPSRREPVRAAGFGDSGDGSGGGDERSKPAAPVQTGGFGSTQDAAQRPRSNRKVQTQKPDTPVEILSKPTPSYTAEARDKRIEGEVALRVTFLASGEIRVLEVVNGLGHGLDEAAIQAAKRIRFKPARRERQPVDHTTTLRIVFQLV